MFGNISFSLETVCRCTINRLSHTFPRTRNIFTNGALIPMIYSACSCMDSMFSFGNFGETFFFASCLLHKRRALLRANLHISVFRACTLRPKVALVSSGTKASATLRKNQKGHVCLLLFFHEWENPELFRGYPYFPNALLIWMIFWTNTVQL